MRNTSGAKKVQPFKMPETFDFGIEERDSTDDHERGHGIRPQRFTATYISPDCLHEWVELEAGQQSLKDEGKTIWHCVMCGQHTNTYSWQKPD